MRYRIIIGALCILSIELHLSSALFGSQIPVPDAQTIERQVVAYRSSLHSGHVRFQSDIKDKHNPKGRTSVIETWFTGRQIRTDFHIVEAEKGKDTLQSICRNCDREGRFIHFSKQGASIPPQLWLGPLPTQNAKDHMSSRVIDPRIIGMTTCIAEQMDGILFHIASDLGNPIWGKGTVAEDIWEGSPCWRLNYTHESGATAKIIVRPDQGPSIVHIETTGKAHGMLIRDIVDVQLKQYRADQRWFPMGSTYRRTFDGNFNSEERITVTEAAFNEEIPKKVFTLAGINPPAGTLAGVEGSNIRHEWDGTSLVKAKSREKFTFESAVDAPVRSYRTLYTVLAIALALGAGFLGLWYYRRKGSPGVIKGTE